MEKPKLKRHIGLIGLVFYGVGDILGAGIYGLVGKAAGEMGNAIWLGFLASMVAAGLTGLSYASLGSRYPRAGGAAYVAHRAFGSPFLAYVVGLAALCSGITSMATSSRAFAGYLTKFFSEIPTQFVVLGFCLFLASIVIRGIKESMWLNVLCTTIETLGLLFVIAVGFRFLGAVDYLDATTVSNASGEVGFSLILSGAVLTFFSFVGFEDLINVSEEVKNPERNIPKGIVIAVLVSSLIYILISLVAVSVVPSADLAKSSAPLVDVVQVAAPWLPPVFFGMVAMFAVANTALLNFIMGSRLMYGMSSQGLLPGVLSKINARWHTPHVSSLVILIIALSLALSGDIASLARATSVLLLLCFTVVNASLFVVQKNKKEPKGQFEVPSAVPALGALVCLMLLAFSKAEELKVAGVLLGLIVLMYFVLRPSESAIKSME